MSTCRIRQTANDAVLAGSCGFFGRGGVLHNRLPDKKAANAR
jgi:hypothetical protein